MKITGTVRVATTRDGESYVVQQQDLGRGLVHCWPDVEGYKGQDVRVRPESRTFKRDDVQLAEAAATVALWDTLFEQARRTTFRQELVAGDKEVVKRDGAAKIVKAAKASFRHQTLKCLCCGQPMRCRTLRTGATFFGCGSWRETGCNARWTPRDGWNLVGTAMEGSELHGSDREIAGEEDDRAAE